MNLFNLMMEAFPPIREAIHAFLSLDLDRNHSNLFYFRTLCKEIINLPMQKEGQSAIQCRIVMEQ